MGCWRWKTAGNVSAKGPARERRGAYGARREVGVQIPGPWPHGVGCQAGLRAGLEVTGAGALGWQRRRGSEWGEVFGEPCWRSFSMRLGARFPGRRRAGERGGRPEVYDVADWKPGKRERCQRVFCQRSQILRNKRRVRGRCRRESCDRPRVQRVTAEAGGIVHRLMAAATRGVGCRWWESAQNPSVERRPRFRGSGRFWHA